MIGEHRERIEIIDREIDQWQGRLERLYDFVETREIEPFRTATRIAGIQDKPELMRRVRLEIAGTLKTRRLEPIGPWTVPTSVKDL